jgi:hypothetical protein
MLLPRTGADQPAKNICLLLSVVSTLVMSVFASPESALALELKDSTITTCAGPTGAWTVGVSNNNDNMLTFVHSTGIVVPTQRRLTPNFKGGNCFEFENTVYYISDEATGNIAIRAPNPNYMWVDYPLAKAANASKNPIKQAAFERNSTAVGLGPNNSVTFIAVTKQNITLWAPGDESHTGVANLSE